LHILITGASSGIGLSLAQHYLQYKHAISVCGRNFEALQNKFENQNIFCFKADVSIENDCKNFIEQAIKINGPIDILINNAGISMRGMFADTDLNVLKQLMAINYWGTVHCCKYALASITQTKGVICSVSSIAGYRGLPARTGYSSSKFAMQGFMESLRTEMLHSGVHIMWVCPGFTKSNIRNVALNKVGQSQGETPLNEDTIMSADECAVNIIKAIAKRKRTLVMTAQGKFTVWLNKLWPALADKLVYKHFAKEANTPLK
jgi:short-subunit dehydrogenase